MLNPVTKNPTEYLPLCVDLDGTIIKSDVLVEQGLDILRQRPWSIFLFLLWAIRGKAHLKSQIARRSTLDVSTLPYHNELLSFLRQEHASGRDLFLTTAANEIPAHRIADHLGIFRDVIASTELSNLSGKAKLQELQRVFGNHRFGYVGNAAVDLHIWKHATEAVVVNASSSLLRRAHQVTCVSQVFPRKPGKTALILRAIRVHQWVKNLLLILPLLLAHKFLNAPALLEIAVAFLSFSLCASSVYVLNDLLDLKSDRIHPTKRARPFASADISLKVGVIMIPLLLLAGLGMGSLLSLKFLGLLILYYALTTSYSVYIKQIALLDVILLTLLYATRIFAGSVVSDVPISEWLMAFSMFFFFSMSMVKRVSELHNVGQRKQFKADGRGYMATDREQLASLGAASGYCAVLVFSLYINSRAVQELYRHSQILWLICPVIFYWISRMWLLAHRGQISEDPIVFALKDRTSYVVGLLIVCILLIAI